MQLSTRTITLTQALQTALTILLAAALVGFAVGCGGGGSNGGGDGDGNGDGDGDGDGNGGDGVTAPAAPSGLTATATDGAVGLEWSAVGDADTYRVYRDTSPTDGVSGSALDTGLSSTGYTDETAENGTTYYYRVTAVNSQDGETAESDGSGEVQGTPFTTPTELSGTSGDSQIDLDWSGADGAESYSVYRSTASFDDVSGRDALASGVSETSYTDGTAENGTTYYYRVTSVNPDSEESGPSNEVEKTPFEDPDRP